MDFLHRALLLCCVTLAISTVSRAIVDSELQTRCRAQRTCADCIRESPDCVWCTDNGIPVGQHCNAIDRENEDSLNCTSRQDPQGQVDVIGEDLGEGGITQVFPQRAIVHARPGSSEKFPVTVQPVNNFPIDIYLLMDLSFSMEDDLANLKRLGTQLAQRVESISENFRIGFGSFVDKTVASFINLDPRRQDDPCGGGCEKPYSFRHVVSLTDDDQSFSDKVNDQIISGNQDFPEGGFDGFLQSIVCTEVIGWRNVSRKILVYISDAGFHFAGDGLLGGVVKPHDGQCHMEAPTSPGGTVDYMRWDDLDFPSIGQIAEKLDEFDIIPILAVVQGFRDLYELLRAELGSRAYVGTLARDSSNVVDLVETLYREISRRIVFTPETVPGVSVTVAITDCDDGRIIDGVCNAVEVGDTVEFEVSVDVIECTSELMSGTRDVELRIIGFGSIVIELNATCSCDCENQQESLSPECNAQGTLVCGLCECNRGYFGDRCQCDSSGTVAGGGILDCPTGEGGLQCSGRGTCTCGICECNPDANGNERFYGLACECDNTVCERGINGEICSGPTHGECTCDGACRCLIEPVTGMPYSRSDCSCTPNNQVCIDPTNATDVCNGRGYCDCGVCKCNEEFYFGQYCQRCSGDPICAEEICDPEGDNALCTSCVIQLLDVLEDNGFGSELFTEQGFARALSLVLPAGSRRTTVNISVEVDAIVLPLNFSYNCSQRLDVLMCPQMLIINESNVMDHTIDGFVAINCPYLSDCNYNYFVADEEGVAPIQVEYDPACPSQTSSDLLIPPWAIAIIIIGLLILLGLLLLLLLKILLMILDYIEVQKFERELAKVKYTKNENPLYHSATKDYKNPIYGQ